MKHDFKFFVKEGAGNMFSHGFMSFAAIGVTVACLLIMGTFTLVAYNADENLADLQQENAIVAFVDETLDEDQARALQAQVEAVDNVEDCSFVMPSLKSFAIRKAPLKLPSATRRLTLSDFRSICRTS